MPRGNQKGGKKHKRGKKGYDETRVLRLKEEGQEYAQITACKGNCRFDVKCCDGKDRMGVLCGAMRKRKFVNMKDVVLVSIRDFQDDKCDIIDTYDDNQVRKLKEQGQIPELFKLEEDNEYNGYDSDVEFVNDIPNDSDSDSDSDSNGIDLDEI
jgi:translation initiation factor 1A